MKLNHLDLHVPDVLQTRDFFIQFFQLKCLSAPESTAIAILEDEAGFVFILQKLKEKNTNYPAGAHVGFYVESCAEVDSLFRQLQDSGFQPSKIQKIKRGYMFYVRSPGGILVEVNYHKYSPKKESDV